MHRVILFLLLLLISGWNWETHPAFAETIYYSLPDDVISFFNLTALRDGSLAPDGDFHDNRYHHYPPSYNLSAYWLDKASNAYRHYDLTTASYAFGVASHYISDSYAAPHNVVKESSQDHSEYERQGSAHYLFAPCPAAVQILNLNTTLVVAAKTGDTWSSWLSTREPSYAEQAVTSSMTSLYSFFWQTFNVTCISKTTTYASAPWLPTTPLTLILVALTLYLILETCYSLIKTK